MLYLPCHSSIVSTQFLFLFFWFSIIHMHYHIIMLILDHQQFSVFFSEDIFFFKYFSIKSNILCFTFQCLLMALYLNSWNLSNFSINFITNQITVTSAVSWIALFKAVLNASAVNFLAWSKISGYLYCLGFY